MAKKVYAIQYGFDMKKNKEVKNIIVDTWAECLLYVKGVKGAKYKSFESMQDAESYLNEGNRMLKKSDENYPKDCLHAYVDGSYNLSDERYSYGVVCVNNNIVEYIENGDEKSTSQKNIRQIAGELKGAIRAVEYAINKGEKKLVIFHDYEGIAHHATGAWSRNDQSSVEYYEKMQKFMKTGVEIIFVKVDSHTGDLFNELVDEKCKEPLGILSDKVVEKYLKSNNIYVKDDIVREQILSIAPSSGSNIVISGIRNNDSITINNSSEVLDDSQMFYEMTLLYKNSPQEVKKKISKMLSKDKEKYIIYLLESKYKKNNE